MAQDRVPFLATISALLLMVALGLFPQLDRLVAGYGLLTGQDYDASSDIGKYIHLADSGRLLRIPKRLDRRFRHICYRSGS